MRYEVVNDPKGLANLLETLNFDLKLISEALDKVIKVLEIDNDMET